MYRYWKSLILGVSFLIFTALSESQDYPVRRLCENPDGTLSITSYAKEYKSSGETDKQFFDRIDALENMNTATGKVCHDVHKDDIPYATLDDSEKWRVKEQGGKKVVFVDPQAPSPEKDKREKAKANKIKAKNELKQLGLSDDALSALGL